MKQIFLITLIFIPFVFTGCGGSGGDSANSCSALKVTNGDNCDRSDSPVTIILGQKRSGAQFSCSGTVISPTAILTAAHCVLDARDPVVDLVVAVPAGVAGLSDRSITGVTYDARYTTFRGGAAVYDQAIIRLAFDAGAAPVPLLGSDSVAPGDTISVFGYGVDEQGRDIFQRLEQGDYEELLKAGTMVVGALNPSRLVFSASFDATDQSACFGDSGGPAILRRNGEAVVAGVVSYGSVGDCKAGSFAAFGNVGNPSNLNWIRGQVPEALIRN
jgi:secreted trypsin-like serine protease